MDQDKVLPSYVYRRDEGELWSLNFKGRVWACWKCGGLGHIGDKCSSQETFDEIFNGSMSDENFEKPTWAVVVRKNLGGSDEMKKKEHDMEMRIKEGNKTKVSLMQKQEEEKLLTAAELDRLDRERIEKLNKEKADVLAKGEA